MSLIPPNVGVVPPIEKVEQNELAAEYRRTVIEIQSQLFDKASTYSNLIMVAGYAGAFTVWGNTKGQLPNKANVLIALLLGFSLCAFIIYQVYKMAGHVNHFRRVRALLYEGLPLQEFFAKYNAIDQRARRITLQSGTVASTICFLICVVPAILAIGLLLYNFAAFLYGCTMWPK